MLTGLQVAASAAEMVLEPIPAPLKTPVQGGEYQDDAFFTIADPVIKMLSNKTVPVESQRMKVYSAYSSLKDMRVSPEVYDAANDALHYLYYTAKTGEAYENFFGAKKSVAAMTDGSEYYDLAGIYYMTASNWWALIADRYPKVVLYTLPEQNAPYPEESSSSGTLIDGLKYPLLMVQKNPDPAKPFQDQEIKTTMQRWIEDNLDTIPNQSDLKDTSQGTYFITSDGPRWAKSTYLTLTSKNVNPEFYDTANNIDAFLYYLSQARDNYDDYVSERTSLMLTKDGQEPYNSAKSYYDEAGVALTRFIDQIPNVNTSTRLPVFPEFEEISRGRQTEQDKISQAGGDSPWSGTSWNSGKSGLY